MVRAAVRWSVRLIHRQPAGGRLEERMGLIRSPVSECFLQPGPISDSKRPALASFCLTGAGKKTIIISSDERM